MPCLALGSHTCWVGTSLPSGGASEKHGHRYRFLYVATARSYKPLGLRTRSSSDTMRLATPGFGRTVFV